MVLLKDSNLLIKVIHGACEGFFPILGSKIFPVRQSLLDALNLYSEPLAFLNGVQVNDNAHLSRGDVLEFCHGRGEKGGGGDIFKGPFPYNGAKTRVAAEVWRRFGDVNNYVEPFLGSGGVLLNRPLDHFHRSETVNDLDGHLVNFFRSAKFNPRELAEVANYPISELDLHARQKWLIQNRQAIEQSIRSDVDWCDPQVAAWWAWGISQWIGSGFTDRISKSPPSSGRKGVHRFKHQAGEDRNSSKGDLLLSYFELLSGRLERVRILCRDWSKVVPKESIDQMTGVFLDPPYVLESGRYRTLYSKEDLTVGHAVHAWAIANGENPKLRIALCGFVGDYRMPESWSEFAWKATGSKNGAKERIWFSPGCLP